MAGYDAALLNLIDARIRQSAAKDRAVGTLVEVIDSYAYVAMDGSALALPCKYLSGFALVADSRVVLHRFGSDWVVTGTFGRSAEVQQDKEDVMTAATGFTLNDGTRARREGKVVSVWGYLNVTSTITATSGNIPDTPCATITEAWRPADATSVPYGNGSMDGEAVLFPSDGVINLRTASNSITAGTNIRFFATYVQA